MKKILLVINHKSGLGTAKTFYARIVEIAQKNGLELEVYETSGKNDNIAVRRYIKTFKPEIIYAVGGDGTVNMVASEMLNKNIALGIFPAGSANGLAYNLGLTDDVETAIARDLSASPKAIDVIKINNDKYCFHLSDIGTNARIVSRFEKEGSKGMLGYGKHMVKEMFEKKTWFNFTLKLPGKPDKRMRAEMLVFANAKSYGTGAIINPTGKLNDGKFEIIILRPYPWWFVFKFIYAFFTGKLHKIKYIKIIKASQVRIELFKHHELQIDGEIISDIKLIEAEIMPGALKVLPGDTEKTEF